MEQELALTVARTLWAIRILYITGDRASYNQLLSAVEDFAHSKDLGKDTSLVRAAKALGKPGEAYNVNRWTKPGSLRHLQLSGIYIRCLLHRDRRSAEGFADLLGSYEQLKEARDCLNDPTDVAVVSSPIFDKLAGDVHFLQGVNALTPFQPEKGRWMPPAADTKAASQFFRQAIASYRHALRGNWEQAIVQGFCIEIEANGRTYSPEDISSAFQAVITYHLGLAYAWAGNFPGAITQLESAAEIASGRSLHKEEWPHPYLLAVIRRDLSTARLLWNLYPTREKGPWTPQMLQKTPARIDPLRLKFFVEELGPAIEAANEAAIRFEYSFDSHPICSAKKQVANRILSREIPIEFRLSDLATLAWLPHPGYCGSMYDPCGTDLITALVSLDTDQYESVLDADVRKGLFPAAFKNEKFKASTLDGHSFVFSAARDWASSIPLLRSFRSKPRGLTGSNAVAARGGGYVLSLGDDAVVIDPGYDFVANYTEQGFDIEAIRAVMVSHDHPDHNSDLTRLDDLIYEFSRRSGTPPRTPRLRFYFDANTAGGWAKRCEYISSQNNRVLIDTEAYKILYDERDPGMRIGKLALEETMEGESVLRKVSEADMRPIPTLRLFPSSEEEDTSLAVYARWWKTQHTIDNSLGFSYECVATKPRGAREQIWKLGYSGDCMFEDSLIASDGPFHDCDVVLLHISQPDLGELVSEGAYLKPDHLGFYGALRLAQGMTKRPKIVILGEFWGGRGDLRLTMVNEFSQRLNHGIKKGEKNYVAVLPSSQGLHLDLINKTVLCNYCYQKWSEASTVDYVRSQGPYSGYYYLCRKCSDQVSQSHARGDSDPAI